MNKSRQCYYHYPKDSHGKYTGHSICMMIRDGQIFHGESLCSPEDNFDKKIGRELALSRAEAAYYKSILSKHSTSAPVKKVKSKVKVSHYESIASLEKYPNNDSNSIYKVRSKEDTKGLHRIQVGASELDSKWTNPGKMYVTLTEDGNGLQVDTERGKSVYLDYSEAHDLALGLQKFHQLMEFGKFKRVK